MRRTALYTALLGALSCARMMAPGGGPEDETPPSILSVEPEPGTGHGDLRTVTVMWSERLDPSSASVFLYPPVDHELHTGGDRMRIELAASPGEEPLIIHLPAGISDMRGNEAGFPVDLVYTASDSLPSGAVITRLTRQGGGSLTSVTLIELYRDTALVRRTSADSSSEAVLGWLQEGEYRLLCYEDPDRSFQWDPEEEAGFDTTLELSAGDTLFLDPVLTVVDTVGPILVEVLASDSYHVTFQFSEEVSYPSFGRGEVVIEDSTGSGVTLNGYWLSRGASSPSVIVETGKLPDSRLTAFAGYVEDLMGNPSRPDSMDFYGVDTIPSDSLRVRSFFPPPGSDNAPPGGPFLISFNYWVHPDTLAEKLQLHRVVDSTEVSGSLAVVDGRSFEFHPRHQLIGEQQYRFLLRPGIGTLWGDTLTEPFSWSFSTLWGDEPGALSGRVTGVQGSRILLQIRRTGGDSDSRVTYIDVGTGDYTVDEVPAGRYTVAAFVDLDDDGTWTGTEPYGTYPGVVLVQPGLMTRDVDIEILP
ncbi:MAG: hypothetical protein AVO35_04420 [Candidatus Aegiribacteria sp. MLS_C]|nr:MAG: hypothetical protein AVO35_04420 [Candidatus Aegiribacteria sp. MLS_C]